MENLDELKGYINNRGKFDRFPGKKQKNRQLLMLKVFASKFVLDKEYSEVEVNEILNQHHTFNDPASIRRMMFGNGLLNRTIDGRKYWLVQKNN